uniref:PD-(D/E)XK nuclease family protein n=1 Tax=Cellulomonas sp. Y8 TaxID=2591145 RepID=UPI003D714B9A
DSELVRRAATREHWRETYVGTLRDDGTVLEGYVDLIYRDVDGNLVIVDYKTDAVPAGGLPSRVAYYTPQIAAYVECLRDATGQDTRAVLLFLHPQGSTEVAVAAQGLAATLQDVGPKERSVP